MRGSSLLHPQIASAVHREACRMIGNPDPFRDLKTAGNEQAMGVCREVRGRLHTFRDFVLASVIGNTFDYAVKDHDVTTDFSRFFEAGVQKGLDIDDTDRILERCSRVVYLTDNCGEIVFDRLLVGFLKAHGSHVTVAVRDAPILNDATMEDALALGFDKVADCLTTTGGGAEIGLDMAKMPADLAKAIDECTIIISKGMANYESLERVREPAPGRVPDVRQVRDDCRGFGDCERLEDRHAAIVAVRSSRSPSVQIRRAGWLFSCSLRSHPEDRHTVEMRSTSFVSVAGALFL